MKTKTKKKVRQLLTKKKLVKKKHSRRVLRAFVLTVVTLSTGSLMYAVALTKPTVDVNLRPDYKTHSITITPTTGTVSTNSLPDQTGRASWYAIGLPAPDSHTCASRTFPRGTYLQVTNLNNQQQVICLVNDYGPEVWTGRVIDLSRGSFSAIANLGTGTLPVEIRVTTAPPASLGISFPTNFSQLTGYSLCLLNNNGTFCENNRQRSVNLKASQTP